MIIVIDYGVGNLGSVANMLRHIGAPAEISSDPERVAAADQLILPGVGAYDNGMANLDERGLVPALHHSVTERAVPLLGFCLGMQLLVEGSDEGSRPGMGWIAGGCQRLTPSGGQRVPHMGWNRLTVSRPHQLVDDLPPRSRFYFAHSFTVVCDDPDDVVATTDYGGTVTAVIARGNIWGTQFHPEKSHKYGMELLGRFATLGSVASH